MQRLSLLSLVVLALAVLNASVEGQTDGFNISTPNNYTVLATHGKSTLYRIEDDSYSPKPYLISVYGSHYEIGYDYAFLLAPKMLQTYNLFFDGQLPDLAERLALEAFLDWQWDFFLSVQLTDGFKDEIRGIRDAGNAQGVPNLDVLVNRVTVVANFPGDIETNIEYLLLDEFGVDGLPFPRDTLLKAKSALQAFKGQQCSFFAVWGNRTADGSLWTMRNLDWLPDSGINVNKLVAVFHVTNKIPYATLGFIGLYGALTGMSSAGLTVHETGNDVTAETFNGFAWTFRLRYVMENAVNLASARKIWEATNNTLGMNHMIASASDVKSLSGSHPAYALETMKGYTAYFQDNDPREAALFYTDPKTGKKTQMGWPLPNALWRTNHGYDPTIISKEIRQVHPNSDSEIRYMILANAFREYERRGIKIDEEHAVNLTSILGDKNGENFFQCSGGPTGINILSVTYHPMAGAGTIYVAWGKGAGPTWRAACCGTYLKLNMAQWWK